NKPVTYASNIWNRGYANCAGHCVVFASALRALQVPYCVVSLTSKLPKKPKHAIMQVGFPEHADIKKLSRRAYELWAQFYGRSVKDPKEKGREARLFTGLKFTRSREGSAAALHKGCGRWLVLDPGAKVGCYQHLIENGYMTQSNKSFWFAAQPQIKNWLPFAGVEPDAGTPDMPHSDSDSDAKVGFTPNRSACTYDHDGGVDLVGLCAALRARPSQLEQLSARLLEEGEDRHRLLAAERLEEHESLSSAAMAVAMRTGPGALSAEMKGSRAEAPRLGTCCSSQNFLQAPTHVTRGMGYSKEVRAG
ncbi:unnamed protein product, partial [Effrenium voratum]